MRVLATIGFSFSAGILLSVLLPWDGWQLYAAAGVFLAAAVWLPAARHWKCYRRGLLILLPLAVSLVYFTGCCKLVRQPVEQHCGAVSEFTATTWSRGVPYVDRRRVRQVEVAEDEDALS